MKVLSDKPDRLAHFAYETQGKFDLYLVSLTFTIMALSIQTAPSETALLGKVLEISSWGLFLISGCVGLWRLEWVPQLFHIIALRENAKESLSENRRLLVEGQVTRVIDYGTGQRASIDEAIASDTALLNKYNDLRAELDSAGVRKYKAQKVSFVVALLLILAARAISMFQTNALAL